MRIRYWRLSITDILNSHYPVQKANHWEIKCIYGEYQQFGIFWFRYGTPFDKDPVHGICFYHNDIPKNIVDQLTEFLQSKFGGKILFRQSRVFLQGSKEFADANSITQLANEISMKFKTPVELTIEFEKVTKEEHEQNQYGFPENKSLPIAGPD